MREFKSKDNTSISYEKLGSGPGLVIVGGSLADHHMYHPLAEELSKYFKVYNYDRRNRGMSKVSKNHSVDSELEDLEMLISLDSTPKVVYGHSAGAGLAIRAAAQGMDIHKLILVDLPFSLLDENRTRSTENHEKEYQAIKELIENDDKEGAVRFFLKDFGMSKAELHGFISSDGGQAAIEISPTLLIDYNILGNGLTPRDLLKKIKVPTMILTSDHGLTTAQDAAKYLLHSSIHRLEAPTHMTAPKEIAQPIIDFMSI
ncbi:alpha/beta fold hydrolase [Algoriphagus namhaensis]